MPEEQPLWWLTKDGDEYCLDLYLRHYSARHYKDGRARTLFCGTGEKLVLRTYDADALFVWRRQRYHHNQRGVNCAIFRNESPHLSSKLIRQACLIAHHCWPGLRHFTYINAKKIRSTNPGYCFTEAGWTNTGQITTKGLLVFEHYPDSD